MKLHFSCKHCNFLLLLSFSLLQISCDSNDEEVIPSPENDFLGKDYFYYTFDGSKEYEYSDKIYVDVRQHSEPSTIYNITSGPNTRSGFGELGTGESEGFSTSYYFWLPVTEDQIQSLVLPYKSETTSFIGFPSSSTDSNRVFQLSMTVYKENTIWRSLNSEEWLNFSSEGFLQKNYHILKNITLLDSSDSEVNIYKIEGEFEINLNYEGTSMLKPVYGKYRIELLVYK
ncbi:hypothetical protein [Aquimarina sediminis]|uniref:hypothetical protein n=1 Tax=Aquimarina sediminis TaxID=2070536 RepID=UPI000CA04807|nr:hypothetical protein [Aquimarina sediminis]